MRTKTPVGNPETLTPMAPFYSRFRNLAFQEMAWVRPEDLEGYDFLEADRPLVARMAAGRLICPR